MSDYLPLDVVSEILVRLPIISILRCTPVCKSWYSLIKSPNFISTHLNRNIYTDHNQIMIRHSTRKSFYLKEHYSLYTDNNPKFKFLKSFHLPSTHKKDYRTFLLIGICNGLIMLVDNLFKHSHIIILWNPSIRKYVTVPDPNLRFDSDAHSYHALGFGFTNSTNECKIVRVVYSTGNSYWVEIYEVSTGSWRDINADISHEINMQEVQVFLNGAVNWLGFEFNKVSSRPVIVLFDMESEVFGLMTVPDDVYPDDVDPDDVWDRHHLRVAKFRDSLSLIHYNYDENVGSCCVWVMKVYGVEESWVKMFTIDMGPMKFRRPVGFGANGHLLMEKTSKSLVSYDPESKQVKFLKIKGYPVSLHADTFVRSLILL